MDRKTYARDKRTEEKHKSDFKLGKTAEAIIAKRLEEYFWIEYIGKDERFSNEIQNYKEDAIIGYGNLTMKIDIKYTKTRLTKWIQLKVNQVEKGKEQGIYTILVSDNRVTLIDPNTHLKRIESGYCNKPTYLFKVDKWYDHFSELQEYILKTYENV